MRNLEEQFLIEEFELNDENIPELIELVNAAFSLGYEKEGGALHYTPAIFRLFYQSPYIYNFIHLRALKKDTGELAGYIASIPRKLSIQGHNQLYETYIPGFFSVSPKFAHQGLGTFMGKEFVKIAMKKGFQGSFPVFDPEQFGITTADVVKRDLRHRIEPIIHIDNLFIRVLDVNRFLKVMKVSAIEKLALKTLERQKKREYANIRTYRQTDFKYIEELLWDFPKKNQISYVRDPLDYKWTLDQDNTLCVVHLNENGEVDGFIKIFIFYLSGFGNTMPIGCIDTIHAYNLTRKEATKLVHSLCQTAIENKIPVLQTPNLKYFDHKILKRAKFINYSQKEIVCFHYHDDVPIPEKINSFYLEWR